MGALVALSVKEGHEDNFVSDLYGLAFYLQHRGPEYGGLATRNNRGGLEVKVCKGSFRHNFERGLMENFRGPVGIGHLSALNPEPVIIGTNHSSTFPEMAICFVGRINEEEIREKLKNDGMVINGDDHAASLIGLLIASSGWDGKKTAEENFFRGITRVNEETTGSFAIAILTHEQVFVARSPDGRQTVVIGKKKDRTAVAATSESTGFYNQEFEIKRDMEPGEVISLKNEAEKRIGILSLGKKRYAGPCVFKWVYTAEPSAIIHGISVADVRYRLGMRLAERDFENGFTPDIVAPVFGSGLGGAIGYLNFFILMANQGKIGAIPFFDMPVTKYSHARRSFTPADPEKRREEAHRKQIPVISSRFHGLKVVVVDDSIVTGLQTRSDLIPKFKACGFEEIHLRITYPQIISVCRFGKAKKTRDDLASINGNGIRTEEEIAEILGADSCVFNRIKDLEWAVGLPIGQFCADCVKL